MPIGGRPPGGLWKPVRINRRVSCGSSTRSTSPAHLLEVHPCGEAAAYPSVAVHPVQGNLREWDPDRIASEEDRRTARREEGDRRSQVQVLEVHQILLEDRIAALSLDAEARSV